VLLVNRVVAIGHSSGGHLALWLAGRAKLPQTSELYMKNPLQLKGVVDLDGPGSRGFWRRASGERVILNVAAQAETTLKRFHSLHRDMALHSEGWFTRAETLSGNDDLALKAFASFESLSGDEVESFAAEIFGGAFNQRLAGLPQQTHRPMHCNALPFAAITR